MAACHFGDSGRSWIALLQRKTPILLFWSKQQVTSRGADGRVQMPNEQHRHKDIDKCTDIVRSRLWWSYAELVVLLQSVMDEFANWMEGCPCHSGSALTQDGPVTRHKRRRVFVPEKLMEVVL